MRKTLAWATLGFLTLSTAPAFAGEEEEGEPKQAEGTEAGGEEKPGAEAAPADESKAEGAAASTSDFREDPNTTYRYINLRFRDVIVPKFMIDIFAEGGSTVNVFTFGPELSIRKSGTEFDFALSYADYSMDEFLFKGKDDGDEAFEIVSSSMKVVYLTVDLLYDIPLDDAGRWSLMLGGGVGIGAVFGNLYRAQAYPTNAGSIDKENVSAWRKCAAPGDGPSAGAFCDSSNNHYGGYDEPSWANGGSKPFIFPWISLPQVSLRFKPIKQMQARFDTGFSLTGFFFGLSAGYGPL